jgi:hypothetical protein
MKHLLTKALLGAAVFDAAKRELERRGFSLHAPNFDPDYPVSLRTLHNIRAGLFRIETVNKLPKIEVLEWFEIKEK